MLVAGAAPSPAFQGERDARERLGLLERRLGLGDPTAGESLAALVEELGLPLLVEQPDTTDPRLIESAKVYLRAAGILAETPGLLPDAQATLELCHRMGRVAEILGQDYYRANAARLLGSALFRAEQVHEARRVLGEALERFPADYNTPMIRVELAGMLQLEGRFGEVLEQARRAIDEFGGWEERHHYRVHGQCMANVLLAQANVSLGRPDIAASYLALASDLALQAEDPVLRGQCVLADARVLVATDAYDAQVRLAARVREEGSFAQDPGAQLQLEIILATGECSHSRREPSILPATIARLEEILESPLLHTSERGPVQTRLLEAYVRAGRLADARAHLGRIREGGELPDLLSADLAGLESRLRLEQLEPGQAAPERHLAELLEGFERFLDHWRRSPALEGGTGFLHFALRSLLVSEVVERAIRTHPGPEGVERAFVHLLRAQELGSIVRGSPAYAPLSAAAEPAQVLARIRHSLLLREDSGLLVLLPGPDRSHLFLLDRERLEHEPLPRSGKLQAARREFVAALGAGPAAGGDQTLSPRLATRGEQLAGLLLPESIRPRLSSWGDLTVVGFGLLGDTPVELLPVLDPRGLGRVLPVSHLTSVPLGLLLAERGVPEREGLARDLLVLAAPTLAAGVAQRFDLPPLPFGPDLVQTFVRPYGDGRARVFWGEQASASLLLGGAARRTRVLQLLCHGVADLTRIEPAALALAPTIVDGEPRDSGIVGAAELVGVPIPSLVIVTACGAGRGPQRRGEDLGSGLAGPLLAAGAQAVVIASGPLEYRAALALSETFHGALVEGASPAEALRRARLALARDPDRSHPAHLRLRVVGRGHAPLF